MKVAYIAKAGRVGGWVWVSEDMGVNVNVGWMHNYLERVEVVWV